MATEAVNLQPTKQQVVVIADSPAREAISYCMHHVPGGVTGTRLCHNIIPATETFCEGCKKLMEQ